MSYKVKLEAFEGPLDLLLHLINRLEIDIYDIPMAQLTNQYIEHLHAMRVLELDELSEYLVLAATLIEIKSKMLLPVHEGDVFDEDGTDFQMEDDPREELIARLLEYKRYKEAAVQLKESAEERAVHFTKQPADMGAYGTLPQNDTGEALSVFDLVGAFQKMLQRRRLKAPLTASIANNEQSVGEKMDEIMGSIVQKGGRCTFDELFDEGDVSSLVVTFLSVLELMKRRDVYVEQQGNFDRLYIMLPTGGTNG
ncbi:MULTISPECIES: segregation/condensation protein A [Sporosarcina]|uniref:segregation/condensation protein A n=1 Tax=Sporosarcina TaxID=1569 RepID=UPI00058E31A7|nr:MULTISPECIES: segregation/condensation protein A [Sporosarcina]WJY28628.1 segregation/condensation protein A [Sporosarcina sp. 0.2-SM1T-5]